MEHDTSLKQPLELSIYGKTPWKLLQFMVQIDPGKRENVTIDAYKNADLFLAPTCALACECKTEDQARILVANLYDALVGYLTKRARISRPREGQQISPELSAWSLLQHLTEAVKVIVWKTDVRSQMLNSDELRPFYEELVEMVAESEELQRTHNGEDASHDEQPAGRAQ